MILAALLLAAADPPEAAAAAASFNPRANELFEAEPVLRSWAVKAYDRNGDGWLTLYEAQPAAIAFRALADSDRDGRVTVREYESALSFLAARFGL